MEGRPATFCRFETWSRTVLSIRTLLSATFQDRMLLNGNTPSTFDPTARKSCLAEKTFDDRLVMINTAASDFVVDVQFGEVSHFQLVGPYEYCIFVRGIEVLNALDRSGTVSIGFV